MRVSKLIFIFWVNYPFHIPFINPAMAAILFVFILQLLTDQVAQLSLYSDSIDSFFVSHDRFLYWFMERTILIQTLPGEYIPVVIWSEISWLMAQ